MKWIKCSDELPEKDKYVLIYGRNGIQVGLRTGNYFDPNLYIWEDYSCCTHEIGEVTHWMPLPEEPE